MTDDIEATGRCFDDASEYTIFKMREKKKNFSVCHGIATFKSGETFAHAWILEDDAILNFGVQNGTVIAVRFEKKEEFYKLFGIQWFREYSLSEAIAAEAISGLPAPWDNRIIAKTKQMKVKRALFNDEQSSVLSLFGKDEDINVENQKGQERNRL